MIAAVPMLAMVGYGSVDVWSLIPLSLFTVLLVVLWAADGIKRHELRFSTSYLQFPIIALVAIGCVQLLPLGDAAAAADVLGGPVSSSLTLDPFATRLFVIRLIYLLVFFAAALTFLGGKKRMQRIVWAIVIFGALMAFAGILQRLTSPDAIYGLRPTPQAIPFGPFVNQHHFAAFMEMASGLTLAALFGGAAKKDKTALLLIALGLMMIAVVMTGSRGGMISMFAVAAFVVGATYAGRRPESYDETAGSGAVKVLAAAAVLIVVVGGVLFLAGADPLVRGIGLQGGTGDVTSGRSHFWSVAWRIFLEHPILGAGLEAFGVAFTRFDTWNGAFRVEQAHNDYLQMLADAGVAGFACLAAFLFLLFRGGLAVIRNSTNPARRSVAVGALAGCFGIAVHSFFDFPLRTPSNAYFFLLLAAMATVSIRGAKDAD